MNLIFTLAIATSLTEVSAVSSLRGVAGTFEDQVAVADGYTIHDVSGEILSLSQSLSNELTVLFV